MVARQPKRDKPANVQELPQRQAAEYIATYANHVEIIASMWDFRLLFYEIVEDEAANPIREKKARVVISPQQAEALSQALNRTIDNWKRETNNLPNSLE